ncbi:Tetratricopeptide repeat [Nesidiocoris tenuis]|uniref:Tetratricopeptide repeat n=1 Tax=Nesidiocoris tenuis TaxID=355587 RepID=A0ABN7A6K1_9HEMI|nr:Tetratricopeptide repeat [Nesidiocoris tenuis]
MKITCAMMNLRFRSLTQDSDDRTTFVSTANNAACIIQFTPHFHVGAMSSNDSTNLVFLSAAYGNLGSVLSSQGRIKEAEHAFRMALLYRPNMAEVHYNL